MHPLLAVIVLAQAAAPLTPHDPAFAPDGRLVISIEGDLWLRNSAGSTWSHLTSGVAWDRQPAWVPDGSAIVFVSDRSGAGNMDLWRVRVSANGVDGEPERLTRDLAADMEPSVSKDGTVVFVRGRGAASRIWVRASDGSERRLTKSELAERWPVVSPNGQRVAYVQMAEGARRLRVHTLTADADSVVVGDRVPESPTWSPDGERVAFYSASPRAGIYVAPLDGRYVNLVTMQRKVPVWSPDGRTILLTDRALDEAGYNGDPDRVGDRTAAEVFGAVGQLMSVTAPLAPDESPTPVPTDIVLDRAQRNQDALDRVWQRIDRVYFASADATDRRARWNALHDSYRAKARAAKDDAELERVIHAMLRERPLIRAEASGRAAIASAHPVSTEAGLEMLRKGGNVVDAAVAVSFALGVVEPDASGVGGYGEMLVSMAGMERPALIEFMARVPEEGGLGNASLLQNGRYPSDGPILAMVPGTVAGMHSAWKRYGSGKLSWADLLAPAIRAARDGYVVSEGLATTLATERDGFAKYEGSKALFFHDGKPRVAGDTIRNPDLAWTLEQIAKGGADGFYKGEVARKLVSDLRSKGNAMQLTDLARYFPADREPVSTVYRGATIYSSAPPASGGSTLAAQLNLLEQFSSPRLYTEDAATLHAMITAWQLVPSGRGRIADPSLWPVNTQPFTSKDSARVRWKCFDAAHALTPRAFRGDTLVCGEKPKAAVGSAPGNLFSLGSTATPSDPPANPADEACAGQDHAAGAVCLPNGTTAFVVGDADGNVVAVTQTLGTWGGNFYVSPGLGFLYNDKLTSYGTDANAYGARLPYARHGSTLAPTIVFRGTGAARRPVLAVGAAGNAWINSAVYQAVVGVLDFGLTPGRALELPRFLPSQRSAAGGGRGAGRGGAADDREFVIDLEDGVSPDVIAKLKAMGHHFNLISLKGELRMGYGSAVTIEPGKVTAGADPRRAGAAGAVGPAKER